MAEEPATFGVVDNLVTQFSSALDCFRELVQNSIDAGSPRVDVWTEYEAGEGHVGTIALHVDDFGEGMDEAIIDDQLTRLFASTKENDLTKIGKFGIGFVSVFALKPKGVLVHTGRGGEYWEIFFHADRSFSKTKLDMPVEGTQITIFKEGDYHRYRELSDGIRATLKKWCKHSETEITFEDRSPEGDAFPELETINEDFEVPGDCHTRFEEPGTEMALAYNFEPIYGFYNRGLTLAHTDVGDEVFSQRRARRLAHVSLKIKSRYLEHTLSRETVMRDENYEKAMALVDQAVNGPLLNALLSEIEALVRKPNWELRDMDRYATLFAYLSQEPDGHIDDLFERPVFREVHGRGLTPADIHDTFRRDGRILIAEQPSDLTRRIAETGIPVVLGRVRRQFDAAPGSFFDTFEHPLDAVQIMAARALTVRRESTIIGKIKRWLGLDLSAAVREAIAAPDQVYLPIALDEAPPEGLQEMISSAESLLSEIDAGFERVGTFVMASPQANPPFFVTGREFSSLMARPPMGIIDIEATQAAVNREHPHFRRLADLSTEKPNLAAYCLSRCLLLAQDRNIENDEELMKAALSAEEDA